jgi:tetratricopeptide (TPR) repeat protein
MYGGRKIDPAEAALTKAHALIASGNKAQAFDVLADCTIRLRQAGSRCAFEGEELAFDAKRYQDGLALLMPIRGVEPAHWSGAYAELQVARDGAMSDGLAKAEEALALDPNEPHACFAKAWVVGAKGFSPQALDLAERAVRGGRGFPALLILAVLRAKGNDLAGARDALQQAAKLEPDDARVAFDLGIIESQDHHYRGARESFLHALRIDPQLADARFELVVLTHGVGADDEARHHLEELAAIRPGDPRLPQLRALLEPKAPDQVPDGGSTVKPTSVPTFVSK